ncbi:MAG: ComEC/Rec2 family competence protein [Candidatus Babeliales bacterium]
MGYSELKGAIDTFTIIWHTMAIRTRLLWHIRGFYYHTFRSLRTQMIVSLCTLPVLAAWGLPFSILTPLGNIIFSPFLFIILLFSSLLFFTELLHIPNSWLVYLLEWAMHAYQYCLSWSGSFGMIPLKRPSVLLLCLSLVAVAALVHHQKTWLHRYSLLVYTCACALLLFLLHTVPTNHLAVYQLPCKRSPVTLLSDSHALIIIDNGALGSIPNGPSFVEYTLLPAMRSRYGTHQIDHYIVLQYNTWTMQALEQVCSLTTVKNIYIPTWRGYLPRSCYTAYQQFIATAHARKTRVHYLHKKQVEISLRNGTCTLERIEQAIEYRSATIRGFCVQYRIEGQEGAIYPKFVKK